MRKRRVTARTVRDENGEVRTVYCVDNDRFGTVEADRDTLESR